MTCYRREKRNSMNRFSDMIRILTLILAMSCLLLADDEPKQAVQIAKTEHVDFASGGTVMLKNSIGELTVEGWDQPGVEITTVKSTKAEYASAEREKASHDLDRVKIGVDRKGNELDITTDFPKHRTLPPTSIFGVATNFDLAYYVKVPRDTRLVVDQDIGEVHFDGVTGDIHATTHQGTISLRLPDGARYAIDAKSDLGSVTSDFPGTTKDRFWFLGHKFTETSQAPHKLYLRAGFGDIIILKIRQPATPK
jgi:hypothetical protein